MSFSRVLCKTLVQNRGSKRSLETDIPACAKTAAARDPKTMGPVGRSSLRSIRLQSVQSVEVAKGSAGGWQSAGNKNSAGDTVFRGGKPPCQCKYTIHPTRLRRRMPFGCTQGVKGRADCKKIERGQADTKEVEPKSGSPPPRLSTPDYCSIHPARIRRRLAPRPHRVPGS